MMNDGLSQHFFIQKADGRLPVQSDSFSDSIGRQAVHTVCSHAQQVSAHGIHRLPSHTIQKLYAAFMGNSQIPFPHIRKS